VTHYQNYFDGNATDRRQINPWKDEVPIDQLGTWDRPFAPYFDPHRQSHSYYYDPSNLKPLKLKHDGATKNKYYKSLESHNFKIEDNNFFNSTYNPQNSVFYQDKYDGVFNLTSQKQYEIFVSKWYLKQADKRFIDTVRIVDTSGNYINPTLLDPALVESHIQVDSRTGASIERALRLQTNYLVKTDVMFGFRGDVILPIFKREQGILLDEKQQIMVLGKFDAVLKYKNWIMVAGYVVSVLMLIGAYLVHLCVKRKSKTQALDDSATSRMEERRKKVARRLNLDPDDMLASVQDDYTIVSVSMSMSERGINTHGAMTTIKPKRTEPKFSLE
jgi:hypothetical protein